MEAQLGAAARRKGFGFSRIMRGADSHMRCLPSLEDSIEPHISSEIHILFISAFNAFTLCKFWAYFALNRFSWVITLCERRGAQIAYSADRVNRNIVVKFSLVGTIVFTLFGRFSQGQQQKEKTHRFVVTVVTL